MCRLKSKLTVSSFSSYRGIIRIRFVGGNFLDTTPTPITRNIKIGDKIGFDRKGIFIYDKQ